MQKTYFHNKYINENKDPKTATLIKLNYQKKVVDINKLLNRVQVEKKHEIKKKIIFYSAVSVLLFLFTIFII
jgi:hypothetical protein|tara:strand:+ start:221 stop:436 length:216 start_codon:yes stop_codon:yes gene_type:complete